MSRHGLHRLLLAVVLLVHAAATGCRAFQTEEATVDAIQLGFTNGSLTSKQLVLFYLDRIARLNPLLHAVIEVNPDALYQAACADADRRRGRSHGYGPLHGVPVLLKDSIATRDRLNTTAGSFALLGSVVRRDAGVVRRLRRAGAVVLGKANLDEWANFRTLEGTGGWSARGGQGRNPYVLSAAPCGSSTGSAIAAAANMAAVTLGTETDGSILCPSSLNSVVGIKPTVGLTSRAGVVPISPRQDTIGPICRTVADAVHVLDAIVGYDYHDAKATKAASKYIPPGGYMQFLKPDGLRGKRLGIPNGFFNFPNGSVQQIVYQQLLETVRKQGAIVVENLDIANLTVIQDVLNNGEQIVLAAEFKSSLNSYLSDLSYSPVRSLAEIIAFNNAHPIEERLKDFGQLIFLVAENTTGIGSPERAAIRQLNKLSADGLEKLMKEEQLDAVITPNDSLSTVLAIGGMPAITVPAGYGKRGVPFGICFGGLKGYEPRLIEIAYAFEQATMVRKTPKHAYPVMSPVLPCLPSLLPRRGDRRGKRAERSLKTTCNSAMTQLRHPLAVAIMSLAAAAAAFCCCCSATTKFEFHEATIDAIQLGFENGSLTSTALTRFYLDQITRLNPLLHAVIEVNPDALEQAAHADADRAASGHRRCGGKLHGVPVLLKDNIATRDRLNTTAGSLALLGSVVRRDAGVAAHLRSAGAVILGKGNPSEWSNFRPVDSGWSARGGQTLNPYVLSAGPCGSSSGPAVAAAANLAAVTLGTETDGSILCPASLNSVVGIKPTVGLTSRAGVIPISPRQDTVGPICRTVSDAVHVLDVIVGYDELDAEATGAASKFIPTGGYGQFLRMDGLKGKRIGIPNGYFTEGAYGKAQLRVYLEHLATLRKHGAVVIENIDLATNFSAFQDDLNSNEKIAMQAEFKLSVNAYLSDLLHSPVRSLTDVIAFNNAHPVEERLQDFGQPDLIAAQETNGIGPVEKAAIHRLNELSADGLEKLMSNHQLDAIVTPNSDASNLFAIGGMPAITVPAGYDRQGVPFGICFGGLKGYEPRLIEITYSFEQATKIRRMPANRSTPAIMAHPRLQLAAAFVTLAAFAAVAGCSASAKFKFEEATVDAIQLGFKTGTLTSTQLVRFYLDRIRKLAPLHAVIEVNPDALAQAARADADRAASGHHYYGGPLHGVPVLLKDNIATRDRLNTTAGSLSLLGSVVRRDSGVAARLRAAGAVILGKTNPSEWSHFRYSGSLSGWSARGGQTLVFVKFPLKNPYVLSADPCGSSSGSAVAAAANLAAVTLGTETDGSILYPASKNSVVGIKPTLGLTSRSGVIPITPRQDTVGPMCRTVSDAVHVLDTIVGYDALDAEATGAASKYIPVGGYAQFLRMDGLRGKRIGVPNGFFTKELYGKKELTERLKDLGQDLLISSEKTNGIGPHEKTVLELLHELSADGLEMLMKKHQLDAIVTPNSDASSFFAIGGMPAITVPAGYNDQGVPFGICFGGLKGYEPRLIEMAYSFEQATKVRRERYCKANQSTPSVPKYSNLGEDEGNRLSMRPIASASPSQHTTTTSPPSTPPIKGLVLALSSPHLLLELALS
uniref:Amidase domain-containing protein n=1 Tax=Leersia perrieri TaxID=77586 RepID=A0A0D9W2G7_9ORYZ